MELDQIEMVRLQRAEAVLDAVADVLGGVDVLAAERGTRDASALRGQHVLGAAVGDEPADQLLAATVVDRGVDEVDALVEERVEQSPRVLIVDPRPAWRSPQLHRTEAERRNLEAGTAERASRNVNHPHTSQSTRKARALREPP